MSSFSESCNVGSSTSQRSTTLTTISSSSIDNYSSTAKSQASSSSTIISSSMIKSTSSLSSSHSLIVETKVPEQSSLPIRLSSSFASSSSLMHQSTSHVFSPITSTRLSSTVTAEEPVILPSTMASDIIKTSLKADQTNRPSSTETQGLQSLLSYIYKEKSKIKEAEN